MGEWVIQSNFPDGAYVLFAPNGDRVGTYPSLEAATAAMRELQTESLKHPTERED